MQRTFRDMAMARSHVVNVMAEGFRQELGRSVFSTGVPTTDRLSTLY